MQKFINANRKRTYRIAGRNNGICDLADKISCSVGEKNEVSNFQIADYSSLLPRHGRATRAPEAAISVFKEVRLFMLIILN